MPLYEYQCSQCEKTFEVIQKFSEAPLTQCLDQQCKGEIQKILSKTSFQLKGTGWYSTDYKPKKTEA